MISDITWNNNIFTNTKNRFNHKSSFDMDYNTFNEERKKYKIELCKYYQQGHCSKGDNCSFAHGEHELENIKEYEPHSNVICKYFLQGYCGRGYACNFSHNLEQENNS